MGIKRLVTIPRLVCRRKIVPCMRRKEEKRKSVLAIIFQQYEIPNLSLKAICDADKGFQRSGPVSP